MIAIGSLFSGIGGLELGLEAALSDAGIPARVAWQVELDPYCRAVLAKHWPGTDRSVVDVRMAGASLSRVDLLCGGPPCQDISGAGKQEGLSGERSGLLFEYLRIVRELRPRACVVENVHSGQWRSWLDAIRCGLEGAGYRVRAGGLRASDVGAPHRRARIFVVAYAHGAELREQPRGLIGSRGPGAAFARRCGEDVADTDGGRREGERFGGLFDREREAFGDHVDRCRSEVPGVAQGDPDVTRLEGRGEPESSGADECAARPPSTEGSDVEAGSSESGVGRDAYGLPDRVDLPSRWPAGRGETQHAWEPPRTIEGRQDARRQRLKANGNAVVPACAHLIGRKLVIPYL